MSAAPSGFSLTDQNGQTRVFPTGRPSLIAFLKEDCNTCNLVAPILEAFHQAWGERADIWVVGQSQDGNQILQDRHGLTLPVLDDSALKTSFAWGFEIVPAVYWLDAEGQGGPCVEGFVRAEWQALAQHQRPGLLQGDLRALVLRHALSRYHRAKHSANGFPPRCIQVSKHFVHHYEVASKSAFPTNYFRVSEV
jgi:thiol-disulfide isomerase/thioredoxin